MTATATCTPVDIGFFTSISRAHHHAWTSRRKNTRFIAIIRDASGVFDFSFRINAKGQMFDVSRSAAVMDCSV